MHSFSIAPFPQTLELKITSTVTAQISRVRIQTWFSRVLCSACCKAAVKVLTRSVGSFEFQIPLLSSFHCCKNSFPCSYRTCYGSLLLQGQQKKSLSDLCEVQNPLLKNFQLIKRGSPRKTSFLMSQLIVGLSYICIIPSLLPYNVV